MNVNGLALTSISRQRGGSEFEMESNYNPVGIEKSTSYLEATPAMLCSSDDLSSSASRENINNDTANNSPSSSLVIGRSNTVLATADSTEISASSSAYRLADPEVIMKTNNIIGQRNNPQEASSLHHEVAVELAAVKAFDESMKVAVDTNENTKTISTMNHNVRTDKSAPGIKSDNNQQRQQPSSIFRHNIRRREGRVLREANIDDNGQRHVGKGLTLPPNQYVTILTRRAIRKSEIPAPVLVHNNQSVSLDGSEEQADLQMYGDTSLGMKLSVVAGKVIVQHLKPLEDGRASPAQLTGVISRGDILLSVNNNSLVNLPLDQLMSGLGPLSTPDSSGLYQRKLRLRFASGLGFELLKSIERNTGSTNLHADGDVAHEMLALFPMVDQLSGMPLFEEHIQQTGQQNLQHQGPSSPKLSQEESKKINPAPCKKVKLDDVIAQNLATFRMKDRDRLLQEFYSWNNNFADFIFLQEADMEDKPLINSDISINLTLPELVELGRKAILGANALSQQMEDVDSGKDLRSFKSWNTTLSQYSRANQRRRRVLDGVSVSASVRRPSEVIKNDSTDQYNCDKSVLTEDGENVDGDELLLRLASHDEIWRRQVIEFLEKICLDIDNHELSEHDDVEPESDDIDTAISNQLGCFLFGESMTKILKKHRKPRSLPSDEVTAVLFDLATKVSSAVPDEITASGVPFSCRSSLVPFTGMKRPTPGSELLLASRFLLDEALPVWLKSFRPLPWEHRRVLWPVDSSAVNHGGSTATSSVSDDLTIETSGTGRRSLRSNASTKRKSDIMSMIEDQEMNTGTRAETCFLVTFYFTQALLPRLMKKEFFDDEDKNPALDNIIVFLGEYGSYLILHTCMAYACVLKAETVIDLLLGIAKYDPRHREVTKQISKFNQFLFYEPNMLTAIVQRLHDINKDRNLDRKIKLIELCSNAYPDIRPWQVKKVCYDLSQDKKSTDATIMANLYYTYLSLLLHPSDGHDSARRDRKLVAEWCELSVVERSSKPDGANQRLRNFVSVASLHSSDHRLYFRDLLLLLNLSMEITEHNLALDLVSEILDDPELSAQNSTLDIVLSKIRCIGTYALDHSGDAGNIKEHTLKRILLLFTNEKIRQAADISTELLRFIEYQLGCDPVDSHAKSKVLKLVVFFAKEAVPSDLLKALALWSPLSDLKPSMYNVLHTVLKRGTFESVQCELSTSLLRLKRARQYVPVGRFERSMTHEGFESGDDAEDQCEQSVWRSMGNGMLTIEK